MPKLSTLQASLHHKGSLNTKDPNDYKTIPRANWPYIIRISFFGHV